METRNSQITKHLQREDVQKRILQSMEYARAEATVTISNAARLFGFTENQLRDWDEKGLLKPQRSSQEATQDGKGTRRRQYTPAELDKLAIIRELMNEGFTPGTIPPDVVEIWSSITTSREQQAWAEQQEQVLQASEDKAKTLPINQRIENARGELFWRYYASHALRLSLMLIYDELPGTPVGLVLPLRPSPDAASIHKVEDLPKLGESLVGWLSKTHSSHTLYTPVPSFQYSTDYSLLPLTVMEDDEPLEEPKDHTRIVLDRRDRRSRTLSLGSRTVETIRRLLAPLYENAQDLRSYFGLGMRDELDPASNLDSGATRDVILDGLADMVIRLGGRTNEGQNRWRFCCILLPKDPLLPLQQHTLVVRAQSRHSPHKVGGTTITPDRAASSLSLRAYQSGQVIYHPNTDASIAHHEVEGSVHSALAVPIGGESGPLVAALYIASDEKEAFSKESQGVVRIVGRMIEEIILTYRDRQRVAVRLTNAIDTPGSVDPLFGGFLSESDFVCDVEVLLTAIKAQIGEWRERKQGEKAPLEERKAQARAEQLSGEVVSCIAVDIDNQSSLATKYGDLVARNLSKEVGLRIREQQRLYANPEHRRLYHLYADRFYLLLNGMMLDEARNRAEQLRSALNGDYRIEARRISPEGLMLPEGKIGLPQVTVRIGVASYTYGKLKELLQQHSTEVAVAEVRAEIMRALDVVLNKGQQEGGNVIISWDIDSWDYTRWSSPKMSG